MRCELIRLAEAVQSHMAYTDSVLHTGPAHHVLFRIDNWDPNNGDSCNAPNIRVEKQSTYVEIELKQIISWILN